MSTALRETLAAAFARALASYDLGGRVEAALAALAPPPRVTVVAIGKASPAMTAGALRVYGARIDRALVVAPDGAPLAPTLLDDPRITVMRASHPIPEARSVEAGERALAFVRGAESTLALISGGASALACAPYADFTLDAKRALTRGLLASGASIVEINCVRRHLSRLKGGGLTRAAWPGRVTALLVSDVLGGAAADIGSGPTVPDATTIDDAREILRRYGLGDAPFHPTLAPDEAPAAHQTASIVASPESFAAHFAAALAPLRVRILPPTTAEASQVAAEYVAMAGALERGEAIVRPAEPSLMIPRDSRGIGGRASHVAALVARDLPAGVAFLAGATDGIDGASDAAGASVDATCLGDRASIDDAIARFDTATLHAARGTAIRLGPTGQNFADVHVLARTQSRPA